MQQFSPGIKDIPESKGERKHKFSISTDIRSFAMALILWREEIENSFYMTENEIINFIKNRSNYDGIDYLQLAYYMADMAFIAEYDCSKILSHLIIDFLVKVVDSPEEYESERIADIIVLLYHLQRLFDKFHK